MVFVSLTTLLFVNFFFYGRHDELVSVEGVYANMWLQQQKTEEKAKPGGDADSEEEHRDENETTDTNKLDS